MKPFSKDKLFKPSPREAKADSITKAVRSIVDGERASFELKTQRLRMARLAKEAEERDAGPSEPERGRRNR